VDGVEVVGRSGVLHEGDPKVGGACHSGGAPTTSVMASTPDLSVGEECQKADLDMVVGEDTISLDQ
jgi:hypothetical protein